MLEHIIQPSLHYDAGVDGFRTAIIGHSHYIEEGEIDRRELTQEVLDRVIKGKYPLRFFTSIARAFGDEPETFYEKVLFLNFIPNVVESRNHWGTEAQISAGIVRLKKVLAEHKPDVAIAFSTKIWWAFHHNDPSGLTSVEEGRDWIAAKGMPECELLICRHPQGASSSYLTNVVKVAQERTRQRRET